MTLPDRDRTREWIGRTVVDRDGADIGVCAALFGDTATGLPEWMYVERDEATVIVPLLDAETRGDRVHVTVTRAHVDGAPRFALGNELSRAQEAALYQHYGIEYSTSTSESLLPAEAEPADVQPADVQPTETQQTQVAASGSAPEPAAGRPVASGTAGRAPGVAAAVAALAGVAAVVVAAVRLRRGAGLGLDRLVRRRTPPPSPAARRVLAARSAARARAAQAAAGARPVIEASGRLTRSGASASAAAVRRAAVDAAQRSRSASTAARTYTGAAAAQLAPLLGTAGHLTWRAVRAGTDSVLRVTDAATEAVVAAVPRVTAGSARAGRTGLRAVLTVGAAAEAVPEAIAETGERLEKRWSKVMSRLSLALGLGVGYVLGARAGRARFDQIKEAAAGAVARPEVQQALEKARSAAPAPLQGSIDKLSGRASGSRGRHAESAVVDPVLVDELDVVVTPPPVPDTGTPSGTDAPLPDPLIPPAPSGDDPTARP
jgi:hypothetical protein